MRKIKGKDLLVFIEGSNGYKSVALSTSCTLSVMVALIPVMTKQSWKWPKSKPGQKTWTVECTAIMCDKSDPMDLIDKHVKVMFGTAAESLHPVTPGTRQPDGYIRRYGEAILTSIEESGEKDGMATYHMTLNGNGELHHDRAPVHGAKWYDTEEWNDLEIWKDI